jgi:F-type H+-transporting ATPase subunit delta
MKISAKKYAQALLESLEGQKKEEAVKQIERLFGVMRDNHDLKKLDMLIKHFGDLWDLKNNISSVEVTTAEPIEKETEKIIKNYIADKFSALKVDMSQKVDKNILGGVVIKKGDRVYDGSLRTRLYDLRNKLNK